MTSNTFGAFEKVFRSAGLAFTLSLPGTSRWPPYARIGYFSVLSDKVPWKICPAWTTAYSVKHGHLAIHHPRLPLWCGYELNDPS